MLLWFELMEIGSAGRINGSLQGFQDDVLVMVAQLSQEYCGNGRIGEGR